MAIIASDCGPRSAQQLFRHRVAGLRNGTSMQKALQAVRNGNM